MNNKSKGYILAIALTVIAVSLVAYKLKLNGANLSGLDKNQNEISWGYEVPRDNSDDNSSETDNTNNEVKFSEAEDKMLSSLPIGEKIRRSFNYPDKEEIHSKMFNAVDNFKTCKGEFIEERPNYSTLTKCTFTIDTENKTSVIKDDTKGRLPITLIYNNNKKQVFDDNDKSYREFDEVIPKGNKSTVRPLKIFFDPNAARNDIDYLGISRYIICSDSILRHLFIYEDWDYTETIFLEKEAYKLEGVIDPELSSNNQGRFSLVMDKETGIILQFLSFDENGDVKYKLECTSLELNTPIDESVYNKDASGYVKK